MRFTGSNSGRRAKIAESDGIFNSKCGLSVKKGVLLNAGDVAIPLNIFLQDEHLSLKEQNTYIPRPWRL